MKIIIGTAREKRSYCSEIAEIEIKSTIVNYNDIDEVLKMVKYLIQSSDVTKIELEIIR
jgi:hypothetical protein